MSAIMGRGSRDDRQSDGPARDYRAADSRVLMAAAMSVFPFGC